MEKKIAYTLKDIAASLGLTLKGDPNLRVQSVSEPSSAKQGQLALAMSPAYEAQLSEGAAEMAMLREGADWQALGLRAALWRRARNLRCRVYPRCLILDNLYRWAFTHLQ
jgi:UDP-3-O-[3-hydroxymyristoyl] glucosamine N-acyltransferase